MPLSRTKKFEGQRHAVNSDQMAHIRRAIYKQKLKEEERKHKEVVEPTFVTPEPIEVRWMMN